MAVWQDQFDVQCSLRRAVIVHGNVQDEFFVGNQQLAPIIPVLTERLQASGYQRIVSWSPLSGARSVGSEDARLEADLRAAAGEQESQPTGAEYVLAGVGGDAPPPPQTAEGTRDPRAFFNLLLTRFSNGGAGREPTAYVIDGIESVFGRMDALSEKERQLLLQLGMALRDTTDSLRSQDMAARRDILVIVTPRIGLVPPRFYQDSAAVASVAVPRPDRGARSEVLAQSLALLHVKEALTPDGTAFADFVDATDGFTTRDLVQLVRLSNRADNRREKMSYKNLIQVYRFGQKESPWEKLDHDKIKGMRQELAKRVKGQDHVIDRVGEVVGKAYLGLSGLQHSARQQAPKGVFFFVGPTGVGKTEMAKALAEFLFGDESACIRFDMSEYNQEHSDQRLVGAPPGYVGYEEGGQLTNAVRNRPFSVLLFDEIEKSHKKIFDKFLQILEDGRLTDGRGDTVSFSESVIIFTSNIGTDRVRIDAEDPRAAFVRAVEEHFVRGGDDGLGRPELLNRIGRSNIIPFNFLEDRDVLLAILVAKLKPLRDKLREKYGMVLSIRDANGVEDDRALAALFTGFDARNGGRGIANSLNDSVIDPLAREMLNWDPEELRGSRASVKFGADGKVTVRIIPTM